MTHNTPVAETGLHVRPVLEQVLFDQHDANLLESLIGESVCLSGSRLTLRKNAVIIVSLKKYLVRPNM